MIDQEKIVRRPEPKKEDYLSPCVNDGITIDGIGNEDDRPYYKEDFDRDLKAYNQKVYPTRCIEWREFDKELPTKGDLICSATSSNPYRLWDSNFKYKGDYTHEKTPTHWCYAKEYEAAKAIEDSWCPILGNWEKHKAYTWIEEGSGYALHFSQINGYWELHFSLELSKAGYKSILEMSDSIITPEILNLAIKEIEK